MLAERNDVLVNAREAGDGGDFYVIVETSGGEVTLGVEQFNRLFTVLPDDLQTPAGQEATE